MMNCLQKLITLLFLTFIPLGYALATPTALNISELLGTQEQDIYFGKDDFQISPAHTDWLMVPTPENSSVQTQFINPKSSSQAKMTVRSETLEQDLSLLKYIGRSVRDYNRFGFEILSQRPLKINNQSAYLVDLKQNGSPIQLRQVLFKKDKTVVILTCSSHQESFKQELKACNQIYRNFKWL